MDLRIEQKSDEKANKFREAGNEKYKEKKYLEALTFYNKSITFASSKKVRSLGFANRSAVYFEQKRYDECLQNIEWARQNNYPAEKLAILKEREVKCKNLILKGEKNVAEDPWNFFKLSYPANEKIPWLVNCLEVRTTKKYGRGIYTTKDLKAGDVISIEQPYISNLSRVSLNDHCMNCYKTNMMNLIPCSQTASMMFCSNDCMDKFYEKTIEMELALDEDMQLLSKLSAAFGGYKKFDNFVKKTNLKDMNKTIFDYDLSNPDDPEYNKNLAMCFLSLCSKKNHLVNEGSRNIYKFVSKQTANHLFSLISLNALCCAYIRNNVTTLEISDLIILLFKSLINHSCLANVFFVAIDNKTVGFVKRPIKAGEQLFFCYVSKPGNLDEYYKEKAIVFKFFKFRCDCQECLFNSYHPKPFFSPSSLMSKKDFSLGKVMLEQCWENLNSGLEMDYDFENQAYSILCLFAFYATFPC